MSISYIQMIKGKQPLPVNFAEQVSLLQYCEKSHVIGKLATVVDEPISVGFQNALKYGSARSELDRKMLQYEMERLERAFLRTNLKPIILKGGAYCILGLAASEGRRVSDLDILLPEKELSQAEKLLFQAGWIFDSKTDNEYDQKYYRENMHELPPFRHRARATIVDVHHKLLPTTSRFKINNQLFIEDAVQVEGRNLWVLSLHDRFIHSAIHSFTEGGLTTPARSIIELYELFKDIPETEHQALVDRIKAVGAEKLCAYALHCINLVFGMRKAALMQSKLSTRLNGLALWAFHKCITEGKGLGVARAILYLRGHYLRMPLQKLIPHLAKKAWVVIQQGIFYRIVRLFKRDNSKKHSIRLP